MTFVCELMNHSSVFGSNVSHSKRNTRRVCYINAVNVRLKSEKLRKTFSLKVSNKTLRTVDKYCGSLDDFLLNTKTAKLSKLGSSIKKKLLKQ